MRINHDHDEQTQYYMTIKPHTTGLPGNVTDLYILLTTIEPHLAKTNMYVPMTSAMTRRKKILKKIKIERNNE